MTGNRNLLTDVKSHITPAMMPDGFVVHGAEKGTMRPAMPKQDDQEDCHVLPSLDTLLVESLEQSFECERWKSANADAFSSSVVIAPNQSLQRLRSRGCPICTGKTKP